MRASFQGPNVIALGNGIARLQTPPLVMDTPRKRQKPDDKPVKPEPSPPKY